MDELDASAPLRTRLRVLSGEHAGVFIDWIHPRLKVGPSEELDVFISDWNIQPIELFRDEAGRHEARWQASDGDVEVPGERRDGMDVRCPLEPWIPVRFGAIILCIGPTEQSWPDDAQLLQNCFMPPDPKPEAVVGVEMVSKPSKRPYGRLFAVATGVTFAVIAASAAMHRGSHPDETAALLDADGGGASRVARAKLAFTAKSRTQGSLRTRELVREVLTAPGASALEGVELESIGDTVVVRGVLASRAAVDQMNNLLDNLPPHVSVSRRFAAVPEIIDMVHESIHDNGLQIKQVEAGRFEVSGMVDDLVRSREALRQVAADLGEFGVTIVSALQPRRSGIASMNGMLIDERGSSYVRTRDGVKHILGAGTTASAKAVAAPASVPAGTTDSEGK